MEVFATVYRFGNSGFDSAILRQGARMVRGLVVS